MAKPRFAIGMCLALSVASASSGAQPISRVDVVRAVKARVVQTIDLTHGPGECGRFEITKRVAWALRHEGVGLLLKTGAQNKCNEENSTDSPGYGVDVLMYADGVVVDILGGGHEGPNTPLWLVNPVPAPLSSWRPPFHPGDDAPPSPPPTPPTPPPSPPPPSHPHDDAQLRADIAEVKTAVVGVRTSLEEHRVEARRTRNRVLAWLGDWRNLVTVVSGVVAGVVGSR